jgi:hypothetical protein
MVVNLTIAKALGLAVPPSILLRAAGDRLKMCAPSPGPNDGVADSIAGARDEAAAFRAAGGLYRRCTRPRPVSVCFRD